MSPVEYPQNDFTKMIEQVGADNRSGIRRAVGVSVGTPMPTAQSAGLGQPVPEQPPLSPEERAELDRLAVQAGVKDESLGNTAAGGPSGGYATLEEAMTAGASVRPLPVIERVPNGMMGMHRDLTRQTAREFLAQSPRLPDFRKVEGIDLVNDRVILDGMDFPIPREKAAEFKQFVVETAKAAIMDKLNEAVGLFALPVTAEVTSGGSGAASADAAVQREPEGSGSESQG